MTVGTGPRQPSKMVSHSSNRPRSDASFHALAGERLEVTDTSTLAMTFSTPRSRRSTQNASGRGCGAEHSHEVGLHRLQLRTPVTPAVRAVVREVEDRVASTEGHVLLLEVLVGVDG